MLIPNDTFSGCFHQRNAIQQGCAVCRLEEQQSSLLLNLSESFPSRRPEGEDSPFPRYPEHLELLPNSNSTLVFLYCKLFSKHIDQVEATSFVSDSIFSNCLLFGSQVNYEFINLRKKLWGQDFFLWYFLVHQKEKVFVFSSALGDFVILFCFVFILKSFAGICAFRMLAWLHWAP